MRTLVVDESSGNFQPLIAETKCKGGVNYKFKTLPASVQGCSKSMDQLTKKKLIKWKIIFFWLYFKLEGTFIRTIFY